jgi:hypothetical protein
MQVASLEDVRAGTPLPRSVLGHLLSTEVLSNGHPLEAVISLLASYRDEWMAIASDRHRQGLAWPRLLAAPQPQLQGVNHASAKHD